MPRLLPCLMLGLLALAPAHAAQPAPAPTANYNPYALMHPVRAQNGMVTSQEARASQIGVDVLRRGGNAVDAAVAVGFALAVTLPQAGNLGGGGFMVVHEAASGTQTTFDFREMAPAAATRDMFVNERGEVDRDRALYSHLSAGVPGTVAGLEMARQRLGTLPLAELVAPAIELAEGMAVSDHLALSLRSQRRTMQRNPATRAIFFKNDGTVYQAGETLVQADLAWSLRQIAEHGPEAFYRGEIARRMVADMEAHGGLFTMEDMAAYRPIEREPVRGSYRGWEIVSMPPPSSGGVHLIQMLNILENFPIGEMGHNSAAAIHHMAEAMKLAYADRSHYLGDPDFGEVPVEALTSKEYAKRLAATIDPQRARPAAEIAPGRVLHEEGDQTTHYSVIDAAGNVVGVTYTINTSFGTGIVAAGTGILLNNEMDDFSAQPGSPNVFGLIGGEVNAVEPRKRPLSSMTPTLLFKDGRPVMVTGTPGGSRIITQVLQVVMNVIDHGFNAAEASRATRVHHQWLPDELVVEKGLSADTLALLRAWGHEPVLRRSVGSVQTIMRTERGELLGASDTRSLGGAAIGY